MHLAKVKKTTKLKNTHNEQEGALGNTEYDRKVMYARATRLAYQATLNASIELARHVRHTYGTCVICAVNI